MTTELILVAHAGLARLFSGSTTDRSLQPLAVLEHPPRQHQPGAGRAGHGSSDHGPGGVIFEPRQDASHKHRAEFAVQLAARIEDEIVHGGFQRLLVFASSPFLGELKAHLGPQARAALCQAVDIDLTAFPLDEVERRVGTARARTV